MAVNEKTLKFSENLHEFVFEFNDSGSVATLISPERDPPSKMVMIKKEE